MAKKVVKNVTKKTPAKQARPAPLPPPPVGDSRDPWEPFRKAHLNSTPDQVVWAQFMAAGLERGLDALEAARLADEAIHYYEVRRHLYVDRFRGEKTLADCVESIVYAMPAPEPAPGPVPKQPDKPIVHPEPVSRSVSAVQPEKLPEGAPPKLGGIDPVR